MKNELPEPEKKPLDSLTIPGQKEAVERFLGGSNNEQFQYGNVTVVIEESKQKGSSWLVERMPVVKIADSWGVEIMSANVQDTLTHIAQHVKDTLKEPGRKWYGTILRDTVEAIIGIPPFETARLQYLILFLIKRGYVPVGQLAGRTFMSEGLLYAAGLTYDVALWESEVTKTINILRETYKDSKKASHSPRTEREERAALLIRKRAFSYHMRLKYLPELAKKVYDIIREDDIIRYYEKIDGVVAEVINIAYNKI